ncbi:MAG: hypothetical protein ABSG57_05795 [Candidatus Bathyarchaeia archaeon]
MKVHVTSIVSLTLIIVMLALSSSVLTTTTTPIKASNESTILVVQNSQQRFWFTDNALNQLGISHDTVNVSEFATMNISKYKIIIVGTQIGPAEEVDSYLDSVSAEVEAWVTSGGCIMVSGQYVNASVFDLNGALCYDQGSGYYAWLPGQPGFVSVSTEWVSIADSNHPITENFTDYDLSNWGSSADGYFILTSGETPLAVHEGYPDRPVLYAKTLGAGKIVATGLDPDYHGFIYNARGDEGKQMAQNLLKAILNWFSKQEVDVEGTLTAAVNGSPFGGDVIGEYQLSVADSHFVTVTATLNITPASNTVFEGWLVNSNASYSLSLGMLGGNNGTRLSFQQLMVNPFIYDSIIISQEPVNDTNPNPSAPIGGAQLPNFS